MPGRDALIQGLTFNNRIDATPYLDVLGECRT